jgi:hypothetical protein
MLYTWWFLTLGIHLVFCRNVLSRKKWKGRMRADLFLGPHHAFSLFETILPQIGIVPPNFNFII